MPKDIVEPKRNSPGYHSYSPRQTKPYTCLVCQKRWFEYENLKKHQEIMHTKEEVSAAHQDSMEKMTAIKERRQEIRRQHQAARSQGNG